jgi:hypothetical protein
MEELNLEKFNPTVAELTRLVEITKTIKEVDINDKNQLKIVHDNRIVLRDARNTIAKTGKALRENALTFQKAVITKEKELIAIIEPEEDRLKAIEEEAEAKKQRALRLAILPQRLEKLESIKDGIPFSEEDILAMDDEEFTSYFNKRQSDKNEADRLAIKKEQDKLAHDKEMGEAEERGRKEAKEKQERDETEAKERKINARRVKIQSFGFLLDGANWVLTPHIKETLGVDIYLMDSAVISQSDEGFADVVASISQKFEKAREEFLAKQRQTEKESAEKAEKERLESDEEYQKFLTQHHYDNSDAFYIVRVGTEIKLYKQVGSYNDGKNHA